MPDIPHRYQGVTVPDLTFPPREGGYAKGHDTREQILSGALRILLGEGYRALSMRRVAAECGLKLGNLTYHFPTREDLVQALLEAVITSYEIEFETFSHDPALQPHQRLALYCELILEDIRSRKTTHFFPELWALSNHDPFVLERVHELYRRARVPLQEVVDEMRPDLDPQSRADLALFMSAAMEGLTVFAGHAKPYADRMGAMEDIAFRAFRKIVEDYHPAEAQDESA
jgi:AcrR family transcriptional regulator